MPSSDAAVAVARGLTTVDCVGEPHRMAVVVTAATDGVIAHRLAEVAPVAVAVSWPVPSADVADAVRWANLGLTLADLGVIEVPADRIVRCVDHRTLLCSYADRKLRQITDAEVLDPLQRLKPVKRADLAETLLLLLQTREGAAALGRRLGIHPQTVRSRRKELNELFDDVLSEPSQVSGLLLALEANVGRWRLESKAATRRHRKPKPGCG